MNPIDIALHAKKRVSIYTLMSYVLHVDSMTYKTYDIQDYIFAHPEEWYLGELLKELAYR